MENPGPACLRGVGLDDLEFLSAGNALLMRRAKAKSVRHAVVVRLSKSRGRYERQGLLLEPQALAEVQRNLAQQGVKSVGKGEADAQGRMAVPGPMYAPAAYRKRLVGLAVRCPCCVAPKSASKCRSWVNQVISSACQPLPVYPQLRTYRCKALNDVVGQNSPFLGHAGNCALTSAARWCSRSLSCL